MDRYLTPDQPLNKIYRVGAAVFAVVLIVFGVLGLTLGLPLLSVEGAAVLGMGSNGLLAVISIVVGAVLAAAALRGGALASTTMATLGALFLTSGLVNLLVLDTELNVLAFRPANVVFSLLAGLALLCTGLYGRLSGALPEDTPTPSPPCSPEQPPPPSETSPTATPSDAPTSTTAAPTSAPPVPPEHRSPRQPSPRHPTWPSTTTPAIGRGTVGCPCRPGPRLERSGHTRTVGS